MIEMEEQTDVTQEEAEAWIKEHYQRPDDNTALREAVEEKCAKLDVPGLVVEFDPEEVEMCGAFFEDALGEEHALEAAQDQAV